MMTPFQSSGGGNTQDASIVVELLTMTEKLPGAFEGTTIVNVTIISSFNCYCICKLELILIITM